MRFTEALKASRSELIYIVRGKDKGTDAWFCLRVEKAKLALFTESLKRKPERIDLEYFGTVLESGWGDVTDEALEALREKY